MVGIAKFSKPAVDRAGCLVFFVCLKGHGNEADFLGFLQKSVPHESLTLPFVPFRVWIRIRKDIRNRKTTLRLAAAKPQKIRLIAMSL